ncbi:hypothetical protein V5O48_014013 [Marasmius crinis-equi]|uniref:Uncharacterized protein n=1 Tax=Marasmius crinis-equi TaxID=585013 RepID=A0ABR3EYI2_9AGAR
MINNKVKLDALLFSAATRTDDPFSSPLSTPPTSRPASLQPEDGHTTEEEPASQKSFNPAPTTTADNATPASIADTEPSKANKCMAEDAADGVGDGDGGSSVPGSTDVGEPQPLSNKARKAKRSKMMKEKKEALDPEEDSQASKSRSKRNHWRKRIGRGLQFCLNLNKLKELANEHISRHAKQAQEREWNVTDDILASNAASSGYVGNPRAVTPNQPEMREYRLDELVNDGKNNFQLVKHLPEYVTPAALLLDPFNEADGNIQLYATHHLSNEQEGMGAGCSRPTERPHLEPQLRRSKGLHQIMASPLGGIDGVGYGMSLGSGQQEPMMQNDMGVCRKRVMDMIRADPAFQRIVPSSNTILTFISHSTMPSGHLLPSILVHELCLPHRDSKNLAFGWCAITVLGNYNWTKGGHLVLWDLKMVIEFPPGSTIYIPSALVCHFNTSIAPH